MLTLGVSEITDHALSISLMAQLSNPPRANAYRQNPLISFSQFRYHLIKCSGCSGPQKWEHGSSKEAVRRQLREL